MEINRKICCRKLQLESLKNHIIIFNINLPYIKDNLSINNLIQKFDT